MILYRELFPFVIAASDTTDDLEEPLFPSEQAWITGACDERRREFIAVRACARSALFCLGVPRPVLIARDSGGPAWPEGIVGSLTHTGTYRAAVCARATQCASLGIDAEGLRPLPEGVSGLVLSAGERHQASLLARTHADIPWDTVMFSAKESALKAWAPLSGRFVGFAGVRLVIDPIERTGKHASRTEKRNLGGGSFTALLDGIPAAGRWSVEGGLIRSAAWIHSSRTPSGNRLN